MNFWVIIIFFLSVMVVLIAAIFMLGALDLEPSESLSEEIESRTGIKISNGEEEVVESSSRCDAVKKDGVLYEACIEG